MRSTLLLVFALLAPLGLAAQSPDPRVLEREILKQLVEINTSDSTRRTRDAADAMARRLIVAGMPAADVQVIETTPGCFDLVARYRGNGRGGLKPILLMVHLDVVPARRDDWSFDLSLGRRGLASK